VSQKEKNATPSKHDARSPIDPNAAAAAAAAELVPHRLFCYTLPRHARRSMLKRQHFDRCY